MNVHLCGTASRGRITAWAAATAVLLATLEPACGADELLAGLASRGVEVAPQVFAELPPAILRFDGPQDSAALRPLAGSADWDRFTADSLTAPVTVIIEPFTAGGSRLAHRVHCAFTIFAPLERLRSDETLRRSLGIEQETKSATVRPLTEEELHEAGVPSDAAERLVSIEVPLLNRVTIRGVVRAVTTEHPDGIEVAWGFDQRLREHPRWRATWTRVTENELGARVEGSPQPYLGCGGIVAVRRVTAADGLELLAIESRMVLGEPEAWFQGSNVLRSKIPVTVQEGVRTLRRRLANAR